MLIATIKFAGAGEDGVTRPQALADNLERVSIEVREIVVALMRGDEDLTVKVLETIQRFEVLSFKIDGVENLKTIGKFKNILQAYLLKVSTASPPSKASKESSYQTIEDCLEIANKLGDVKEMISALTRPLDYKDFAEELATAVKNLHELTFEPPLHAEGDKILFKLLSDVTQILVFLSDQEQQLRALAENVAELDGLVSSIAIFCSSKDSHVKGRAVTGGILGLLIGLIDGLFGIANGSAATNCAPYVTATNEISTSFLTAILALNSSCLENFQAVYDASVAASKSIPTFSDALHEFTDECTAGIIDLISLAETELAKLIGVPLTTFQEFLSDPSIAPTSAKVDKLIS